MPPGPCPVSSDFLREPHGHQPRSSAHAALSGRFLVALSAAVFLRGRCGLPTWTCRSASLGGCSMFAENTSVVLPNRSASECQPHARVASVVVFHGGAPYLGPLLVGSGAGPLSSAPPRDREWSKVSFNLANLGVVGACWPRWSSTAACRPPRSTGLQVTRGSDSYCPGVLDRSNYVLPHRRSHHPDRRRSPSSDRRR